MGGTPGGIIDLSWAATSGAYGGSMAAIRVIGGPFHMFRKSKHTRSFRKSQRWVASAPWLDRHHDRGARSGDRPRDGRSWRRWTCSVGGGRCGSCGSSVTVRSGRAVVGTVRRALVERALRAPSRARRGRPRGQAGLRVRAHRVGRRPGSGARPARRVGPHVGSNGRLSSSDGDRRRRDHRRGARRCAGPSRGARRARHRHRVARWDPPAGGGRGGRRGGRRSASPRRFAPRAPSR